MIFLKRYKVYITNRHFMQYTIKYNDLSLNIICCSIARRSYIRLSGNTRHRVIYPYGDLTSCLDGFIKHNYNKKFYFNLHVRKDFIELRMEYGRYRKREIYKIEAKLIIYSKLCHCNAYICLNSDICHKPISSWNIGYKDRYYLVGRDKIRYSTIEKQSLLFVDSIKKLCSI